MDFSRVLIFEYAFFCVLFNGNNGLKDRKSIYSAQKREDVRKMDHEDSRPKNEYNRAALVVLKFRRNHYDEQKKPSCSPSQQRPRT